MLTWSGLSGEEYSELSTRFKGSHVRLMLLWLSWKSQEVADHNPMDGSLQVLASCCYGLQRATELQAQSGLILEQGDAQEASDCLHMFVRAFAWLALACHGGEDRLFKCRPKLHYLIHTADDLLQLRLNQLKIFSTFTEESFLGKIKAIALQVHGRTLTTRVFQRYILAVGVSLHHFKGRVGQD